jgi:hypothetical protein
MTQKQRDSHSSVPRVLPGLWREDGGLTGLVRLDIPAVTAGMVVVAKRDEPWQRKPELRWQVWPDLLVPDTDSTEIAG